MATRKSSNSESGVATKPRTSRSRNGKATKSDDKESAGGRALSTDLEASPKAPAKGKLYREVPEGKVPEKVQREILYHMMMTREVDDRIERKLYRQGKILGGVYTGRGQEAISIGFTVALQDKDFIIPSHRDMGVYVARGMPLYKIFAQYLGRKDGPARGKDGNMHMGDLKLGLVSFVSMLADSVPIATGAAMAFKIRKEKRVSITFGGEGATSRGDWHEGINLASVQKAPVVFVVNNNQYAYSTPIWEQYNCETLAVRGVAYGIPGYRIDGNDPEAVYLTAKEVIENARAGNGPSLVECITFRMTGHSAHDDPSHYVPKEMFETWQKKDPIDNYRDKLLKLGVIDQTWVDEKDAEIKSLVDEAVDEAEKCPYPEPEETLTDVYYDPDRPVINQ